MFAEKIQKSKPAEYKATKNDLSIAGLLIGDKITIQFEVGNHYVHLKGIQKSKRGYMNDNHWTAFVRLKNSKYKINQLLRFCQFELHESFNVGDYNPKVYPHSVDKNKCSLARPGEISISYKGWGYFDMPITITFRP